MELIVVILIVGILAVTVMSRFESSRLIPAQDQLVGHLRYTQHLAMNDDRYDPSNVLWHQERWQMLLSAPTVSGDPTREYALYVIFSDRDHGGFPSTAEIAVSPLDSEALGTPTGQFPTYQGITKVSLHFGISDIASSCGSHIAFDQMGRPYGFSGAHNNLYRDLLPTQCIITITHPDEGDARICIEPFTGYIHGC